MKSVVLFGLAFQLLFMLFPFIGKGETNIHEILQAKPDTNKVKSLSDLCWEYRTKSADSAIIFGEQALELAQNLNFQKGIAQAYNDLGIIYIDKANYRRATEYLEQALTIREGINDFTGIASIHNKLGIIHQKQGRLKDALEHQISALKIFQQLKQDKWIGYSLNNIAIIHNNLGNLEKALEYHQKALEYRILLKDREGETTSYGNMANLYANMKDTLQAVEYYKKAIDLSRELENNDLLSANLSNMANIFMARKNYNEALKLYNESLTIREKTGDSKGISSTLSRIGTVYTETGKYRDAAKALNRSLQIAQNISTIEEQLSSLLGLAKLKALTNQPDSAIYLMKLYIATKDSVYDARIKQQILDVQSQYETEKLEQDLELVKKEKEFTDAKLQNRKTQLLLLISLFFLAIVGGIFLFYRHQQKQKSVAAAERIREQEIRMSAVFEAQEQERRRIAKELHDGVGQTITAIRLNYQSLATKAAENELKSDFGKIEEMLDSAGREVRSISHQMIPRELEQFGLTAAIEGMLNLNLEKTPVQFQFEHSGFSERINPQIELVLFRILQELISNVIKHSKATNLSVQLIKLKSHVALTVADNGIGFDLEQKEKNGIGLLNIASRIDGIKGHLRYETSPGAGTTVTIRIPIA